MFPSDPPVAPPPVVSPVVRSFDTDRFRREVDPGAIGRMTISCEGRFVYESPGADEYKTSWSSVCRTVNNLAWGSLFERGILHAGDLDRRVLDLAPAYRHRLHESVVLRELLSTTIGGRWAYSGGLAWPANHELFAALAGRRMHEDLNDYFIPVLGGHAVATEVAANKEKPTELTMRIEGSCYDLARFGDLMLQHGRASWSGTQLVPAWYLELSIGGGARGDGVPNPLEGYQTHLYRDGRHSESRYTHPETGRVTVYHSPDVPDDTFFAYGGTDRAAVAVVPSLGLVIARHHTGHGYPIDTFLGAACRAVRVVGS